MPLALAALLATLVVGSGGAGVASGSEVGASGAGSAPWSASLGIGSVQRVVYAEASFLVPLSLRNTGTRAWSTTGPDALQVAYHWLRSDASIAVWDGQRTPIAESVRPGGSTSVSVVVVAPAEPGRYRLQFDLVSRDSGWFSARGWAAPTASVTVGGVASEYFGARVSRVQLPADVTAGSVYVVNVRVTNTGRVRWPSSGPDAVSLSYHWLRLDGSYAVWDGRRTTLAHPVDATASIVQPLVFEAPPDAGRYALVLDPISLQVGWFSRLGSTATPSPAIEVGRAGSTPADSGSASHRGLALVAVLVALIGAAIVSVKRMRRRDRAIDTADAASGAPEERAEVPPTAIARSSGLGSEDEGPRPRVSAKPATRRLAAPTVSPTNGSDRGDEADEAKTETPAAAPRKPAVPEARPKSFADYMRARGALRDR